MLRCVEGLICCHAGQLETSCLYESFAPSFYGCQDFLASPVESFPSAAHYCNLIGWKTDGTVTPFAGERLGIHLLQRVLDECARRLEAVSHLPFANAKTFAYFR